MLELANKMRMLYGRPVAQSGLPSTIFGSADNMSRYLDLNRARVRVGMWPLTSESAPEVALGVGAALCLLLENYQEVEVHRLFARLDGKPEDYQWTADASQFDIDDWQLNSLGENVAIWGTLEKKAAQWQLELEVENDMLGDVEPKAFTYSLDNLEALTKRLPQIAQEIATSLELEETRPLARSYERIAAPESVLEALYKQLFQWELKLLLTLWGQEWAKDDITAARAALLTAAKATGVEFGAWAAARVLSRAMLPGFQPVGESLMSGVPEVVDAFTEYSYPVVVLAVALYRLNYAQEAYDLLEEQLERTPQELDLWLALAELYLASRQLTQVIRAFQDAIEEGAVSTRLYLRYAEILRLLSFENYPLNDFMLISPEDFEDDADLIRWETIEAYEEVLKLVPDHQDALYQQLLQMAEVEDERFWEKFEALVKRDKTGDKVRSVIDALYDFEDVDEGIAILKRAIDQEPKRYDLHANLGDLYLFVENTKAARTALNTAKELTNDEQARADIDRLLLSVEDPEFEARLGELTDIVNAGSELDIEHVEFLEGIVEKAPRFGELYVLLGKAYLAWGEPDTALETLLDGQKYLPLDPDILELLGRVLWELDQRVLAFEYLNKGIAENPTHVPLLARMGRCHFDNDETELSKVYLLRAEAVNPRHPALSEARAYISRMLEAGEEG